MELYEGIFRRKSCRKFTGAPLSEERLLEVRRAIEGFERLYDHVELEYRIVSGAKGLLKADAPHYLIVSGQGKPGELEAAGFLFQQLVLWFDVNEIGCVWLGGAKASEKNLKGRDIILIAFGEGAEEIHRSKDAFLRKALEEITNAPQDPRMEALRLAPSGINLQPWYWERGEAGFLLYKAKPKGPMSLVYKLTDLDMGIVLCHYALACRQMGKSFDFTRTPEKSEKRGYALFGEISDPA